MNNITKRALEKDPQVRDIIAGITKGAIMANLLDIQDVAARCKELVGQS